MMRLDITLRPGTPPVQAQGFLSAGLSVSLQVAFAEIAIGAAIVSLAFASKAFLESVLSEFGKDSYDWAKAKFGILQAQEHGDFQVEYHISVGDIQFFSAQAPASLARHDSIIQVVRSICNRLEKEPIAGANRVKLIFDPHVGEYTEARVYVADVDESGVEAAEFHPELGLVSAWELKAPIRILRLEE